MIKGKLSESCLPTLLITILKLRKTGRLTIHESKQGFTFYFEDGKLRYSTTLWAKNGLARLCRERGLLSENDIDSMLIQESTKSFEEQLFELKAVPQTKIMEVMEINSSSVIHSLDLLMNGDFVFVSGKASFTLPSKKQSIISLIIAKTRKLEDLDVILPLLEPLDAVPELDRNAPGFQTLAKVKLTAQEGFILSRIDGYLDFNKIFAFCGKDRLNTARFLLLLNLFVVIKYNKGAQNVQGTIQKHIGVLNDLFQQPVTNEDREKEPIIIQHSEPDESSVQPTMRKEKKTKQDDEDNDEKIMAEVKKRLITFPDYDFYQILDIPQNASPAKVKKAYFLLAKKFHPDNFYRKLAKHELAKVEEVFDYIKKAYDTLIDDERRKEYNQKMRKGVQVTPIESDPVAKKKASSDYQYKQALLHIKQKDYTRAIEFLKAALDFDPENALVLAKYAEMEFLMGRPLATAEKYIKKAIELRDKDGLLNLLYAKILLKRGRINEAEKYANRAIIYAPDHPEVRKTILAIKQEKQKANDKNKKGLLGKLFS